MPHVPPYRFGAPPPRSAFRRALVKVGAIVIGGFVLLAVIGALLGPDKPARGDEQPPAAPETCDDSAAERKAWITARDPSDPDGFSPHAKGFRATGRCSRKIADKMLSCDSNTIRGIHGKSPIMRRAFVLGFTAYVCELVGTDEREEFSLDLVIAP